MHRLIFFFLLILASICAAQEAPQPSTGFDEAKALNFLDRYLGRWVGTFKLSNMAGEVLQELEADVVYHCDITEDGRMLKGRAVYGAENGIVVAESETFIANWQIFSIINEGEKQRTYRGVIDKDGKTIAWAPIDVDNPLEESFRETFGRDAQGRETLTSRAYQNFVRNDVSILLAMHGVLHQEPLEKALDTPARDY